MARILAVDDTPQNLTLVEVYLRGSEFVVMTAASGQQALELCRQQDFDLILLDVAMPGIDGFETCRRLKDDPRTAFVPVIFLTARLADESEKLAAYLLGAVDYIQKPIHREELLARIRVMLRLGEARSRLERENVALRRQLEGAQEALAAAEASVADLQRLRSEWSIGPEQAIVIYGADGRVAHADEAATVWLSGLGVGAPPTAATVAVARLQRLVADGARSAELELPAGAEAGATRSLRVQVRILPHGQRAVLLQDVTGVRAAEARIADREPVAHVVVERSSEDGYRMADYIGRSPAVAEVTARVAQLRQTRATVLIQGESGTGKEIVARALHFDGRWKHKPFIPLHCGAIAPELVESELFGHEKGAFTGAAQARDGLFQAADGGTIFLDEIAETSLAVQVKLLRVLQRGEIRPVGASQPRIVDVRIVAATHRDLLQMVREGTFREDLYYRLQVVTLRLPPLRDRLLDLPLLIDHFLAVSNRQHDRLDRPVRGCSRAALACLAAYPWPGNVRELENVVERAFALGVGELLQAEDLPAHVREGTPVLGRTAAAIAADDAGSAESAAIDWRSQRSAAERHVLAQAIKECDGDKTAAARKLGMPRSTFYRRVRDLGL